MISSVSERPTRSFGRRVRVELAPEVLSVSAVRGNEQPESFPLPPGSAARRRLPWSTPVRPPDTRLCLPGGVVSFVRPSRAACPDRAHRPLPQAADGAGRSSVRMKSSRSSRGAIRSVAGTSFSANPVSHNSVSSSSPSSPGKPHVVERGAGRNPPGWAPLRATRVQGPGRRDTPALEIGGVPGTLARRTAHLRVGRVVLEWQLHGIENTTRQVAMPETR